MLAYFDQVGLKTLVDLTTANPSLDFIDGVKADLVDFTELVGELLCYSTSPSTQQIEEAIDCTPRELHEILNKLTGLTESFESFLEVKTALQRALSKFRQQEQYFLRLGNIEGIMERLYETGFIVQPQLYLAKKFLQSELDRNVYVGVQRDREDTYEFFTPQLRIRCVPERDGSQNDLFIPFVDVGNLARLNRQDGNSLLKLDCKFVVETERNNIPEGDGVQPLIVRIEKYFATLAL